MTEVFLGRLVKAFGIRGEVKLHPSDDFWPGVLASKRLFLQAETAGKSRRRPITFARSRPHGNSYIVRIDGVDDRDRAEGMVGGELFIEEDEIDVELPDKSMPFQIIGSTVKDENGVVLGKVTSVVFSPAHDVYEVTGRESTFLLPVVPEFVISHDGRKHELVIRIQPGLIDD